MRPSSLEEEEEGEIWMFQRGALRSGRYLGEVSFGFWFFIYLVLWGERAFFYLLTVTKWNNVSSESWVWSMGLLLAVVKRGWSCNCSRSRRTGAARRWKWGGCMVRGLVFFWRRKS